MPDISISYKGNTIATMDASGTKTLLTSGKYCEDDISIAYTKPSGGITEITTTEYAGYPNTDGTIHSQSATNKEYYTNNITVNEGDILLFKWSNATSQTLWAVVATYDGNGTFIARQIIANTATTNFAYAYVAPSGVASVVFGYRTFGTANRAIYSIEIPN